jgi:NAD(P)-dependent dehydrogenase (short-subunit alcohol dehydrogenase family)/acyl dehydratase
MDPEPRVYQADEIRVGLTAEYEREITPADILAFAENSGDYNPLHVDRDYAAGSNFQGCIAHGAFQVGLASALAGMYLPGRNVLLGTINARFPAPLYPPRRVLVRGEITAWNTQTLGGQLRVGVLDAEQRVAYAEIGMSFTLHGSSSAPAPAEAVQSSTVHSDQKVVLVTGAAGGIGSELVASLAPQYQVIALINRRRLSKELRSLPTVREVETSLTAEGWAAAVREALGDQPLYGIVHAAWPAQPRCGLLESQDDVVQQQLSFGTVQVIHLARVLFSRAAPRGGRLIVLGSTAGTFKPHLTFAPYSLGKAALEHTTRLLAPELARKQITINVLCPSYVPIGLNKQADERQQKVEAARVPLGRLCSAADVAGAVQYLLSPAAAFVSGQVLCLTGGQL